MNYRKSSAPYLLLLIILIVGIPVLNYQVEKEQTIKIEIKEKPTIQQKAPIALVTSIK